MNDIDSIKKRIKHTVDSEVESAMALRNYIYANLDIYEKAVDMIVDAPKVVIAGMGKSGLVSDLAFASFISTGTKNAVYTNAGEMSHGNLGLLEKGAILIAVSHSGETKELGDALRHCLKHGNKVIAITGNAESTLAKYADIVISDCVTFEACVHNLAPTSSLVTSLMNFHCLVMGASQHHGFTAEDFKESHPGGKLGDRLKPVKEKMLKHIAFDNSCTMFNAMLKLSESGVGTIINLKDGKVNGILTDGDLRRLSEQAGKDENLLVEDMIPVEVMSNEIRLTVNEDTFLEDVEILLKQNKVSAAPVVNNNDEVVGIIHINNLQ